MLHTQVDLSSAAKLPPPRIFFVDCDSALPKTRILKITRYENVSLVYFILFSYLDINYIIHKKSVVPLLNWTVLLCKYTSKERKVLSVAVRIDQYREVTVALTPLLYSITYR